MKLLLLVPIAALVMLTNKTNTINTNHVSNSVALASHQQEVTVKTQSALTIKLQKAEEARVAQVHATEIKVAQNTATLAISQHNCEPYRKLFEQYPWDVRTAMAICAAESQGNPTAVSPTCDHGLMQINCVHSAAVGGNLLALHDPVTNLRVAYAIYIGAHGTWGDWTTYTSGAYLAHL